MPADYERSSVQRISYPHVVHRPCNELGFATALAFGDNDTEVIAALGTRSGEVYSHLNNLTLPVPFKSALAPSPCGLSVKAGDRRAHFPSPIEALKANLVTNRPVVSRPESINPSFSRSSVPWHRECVPLPLMEGTR